MHNALIKEKGFLCEKEIISRIVNDTIEIGFPRQKSNNYYYWGKIKWPLAMKKNKKKSGLLTR